MAKLATIRNNFSRNAAHYDKYAHVQRHAADHLIEIIGNIEPQNIADLGCGTGILTEKIASLFPNAKIDAFDISNSMLDVARQKLNSNNICFILSDINEISSKIKYDLIVSNACFQWLSDINVILEKCNHMLVDGGTLAFSVFGPRTYQELQKCVGKVFGIDTDISAKRFVDPEYIRTELEKLFSNVTMTSHDYEQSYNSILDLLLAIKYTGTRGTGLEDFVLTKKTLRELESCYLETFGSVRATFQLACFAASKGSL